MKDVEDIFEHNYFVGFALYLCEKRNSGIQYQTVSFVSKIKVKRKFKKSK